MAHFSCFSNAQQSRQRRDEMPIFSRKGVNCEGAPALTFSYLHIHTIYITLTVRRMVRKPSQKIVRKIGQIIAIFFRRIDSHSRLLRPSLFLRNHECVHT